MPDPVWSFDYEYDKTPEANGFTRIVNGDPGPVITEVTSGNPANRRVDIDSTGGDAVFVTTDIPALDPETGATAEALVDLQSGDGGDVGCEMTFLNRQVAFTAFATFVSVTVNGIELPEINMDNLGEHLWRILFGANEVSLYRDGVLVVGPVPTAVHNRPFQRVLWWVEGDAIASFKSMKFYLGGAVAPG